MQCSRAWALLSGRDYVTPDDVQAVVGPVFGHRLTTKSSGAQASLEMMVEWSQQVDVLGS